MSTSAFRANQPELDIAAIERDLSRIPAVSSARVVLGDEGDLLEIHLVSGQGRSPKLVGRDAQSLLAARWGVDVDHRKVSVVQIEGDEPPVTAPEAPPSPSPPPEPRPSRAPSSSPVVTGMSLNVDGTTCEATVTVAAGDRQTSGRAAGIPSWAGQRRLVAVAALEAFAALDPRGAGFSVSDVTSVRIGAEDVIVTTLLGWRDGAESTLVGAVPIGASGELRAAAESVVRAFPAA